ncbi:Sorbitol dehydrogenase [Chryseobacterium carnipullorum]|uniref:Sorbitol dehydrogenase n=1 Tax=Chryseobacterium carnipullorum TaxID=1124835 RepID=A0A376E7T7_CHRCU|nr:Sorbitol dehydrogenase [Chryseobacterium carnipullorum]
MSTQEVKGKVVLIAGGGKNLGGLLSRDFAAKGAKLAIHYNSESSRADSEKTLAEVQELGAEAFLFQADLTKVDNISRFFDEAVSKFGGIDIAINTVGMVLKKPFAETTEEEYDTMFNVNSKSAYFFLQEAGKKLNDHGKICTIVTSLLAAYTGLYSTYAGAKSSGRAFYKSRFQRIWIKRNFGNSSSARSNGYPFLLWSGNIRGSRLSSICFCIGRINGY